MRCFTSKLFNVIATCTGGHCGMEGCLAVSWAHMFALLQACSTQQCCAAKLPWGLQQVRRGKRY